MPTPAAPAQHHADAVTAGRTAAAGTFAALIALIGAMAASFVPVLSPNIEGAAKARYRGSFRHLPKILQPALFV